MPENFDFYETLERRAEDIVDRYYSEGLTPKQAIEDVFGPELCDSMNLLNRWKEVWNSGAVCKELSRYRGDKLQEALQNRTSSNLLKLEQLAEQTGKDDVEYKIRKYLAEAQGITKTDKVEIEHSGKFDDMGAEEMIEWLENIPGVNVDQKELIQDTMT